MQADAQARARRLLSAHRGVLVRAGVLGVTHSLLLLGILLVGGLLAEMIASRGEARFPTSRVRELPSWVASRASGQDGGSTLYADTGLLPAVTANMTSDSPVSRFVGRSQLRALRSLPALCHNTAALALLLALGLVLLLVVTLIAQSRRALLAEAVCDAASSLRRQVHRQMYRLGQSSLPTEGTGPVINLITREVNDVRDGLFAELDRAYRSPVLAGGLLLYALAVSPTLTLFLISLGILTGFAVGRVNRAALETADGAVRDAAVHLSLLHEDLGMLRTVRVFGMEKVDNSRFDEHLERFREADARRIKSEARLNPTTGLVYGIAGALAAGLIGFTVVQSKRVSPAGALGLVVALCGLVIPCLDWLRMRRAVRQANRSAAAIFEFLDRQPELHQQGGAQFLAPLRERVTFENVSLESRSGRVLLDGISAEFPAGSRTAIMSLDEDAKHALVCLIPRLIDPKAGRVRIDGHDLREVTLESIRAQVATVLQADLVFTDSVAMNIGLDDPSYDLTRIIEAAKVAHAHHFIQDLPEGYDTVIGPVGHYLRLDEQYRIALARAYLHDPSIVVIEEPDLSLDEDTKHLIDDTVGRLSRDRTVIVLPHRLSTIRSCTQVVLLHNGKVAAIGPPRQLESDNKLFRHLQYVEFNPFAVEDAEAAQALA